MCFRVALHSSLRLALVLSIAIALLPAPCVSMLVSALAQGQSQGHSRGNGPPPGPGKPEGSFPNVEDIKGESLIEREPPGPIYSTVRSQRNSGKPWDGRRVGDPEPSRGADHGGGQTFRAHARRRLAAPLLMYEDQFIQNFFTIGFARSATYDETLYWNYQFRAAYNQSAESLKYAAIELGRTIFESATYAVRNRDAHWYVYDLYKTYLMRDPDSTGWANWEATVGTNGREYVRRGFEESTEFANLLAGIVLSGPPSATATSLISARVDPRNQPGNGMLARDAAWSVPLLSLPGRNGLDLGLALSYSSMVWTRSGPYIYFDEDNGFPSPGFRLGFPTVQRKVFDAQTGKKSYLLITGSGKRVALRQSGTSNIYEAGDSSYLQITDNGSSLLLRDTSGTQMELSDRNGEYRCTSIKDRNGNYLTINYDTLGHITNVIDTLGRLINFNYDTNANLVSITQAWNGQPAHQWVSFGWSTRTMQSSFTGLTALVGSVNGAVLPVITQVALNDTSYFTFDYTNSLQVSLIKQYFGTTERNATSFTYETPGNDVPRLLSTSVSAQNWTGINGVPAQVTTQYSVAGDGACVLTAPDGTIYKEYYGTGWQRGLTTLSEIWSGGVRQKWTTTAWTQDNTSVGYEVNPRVTETNIYDAGSNRRRTVIDYGPYATYGLPYVVHEYAADGATLIRDTFTDYNLSQAYLDRRIIGLISAVHLTNAAQYQTKITYDYDDPARLYGVPAAATQHDVNYNLSFTARGNVTAVTRWDVNDINNAAKKLTSYTNYYNTGTPITTTDPAGHQNNITYADSFSDSVNRNTFAYPTTITDADGFSSSVQYNFDFGATTRTQSPTPSGQSQGAIQTMTYNNLGQLERITTTNNGAYKRFWYGADYTASFATVNNVADEAYSTQIVDGLGRVIVNMNNHPGSTGGYSFVNTIYNQMGRASKVSNPTEVNGAWAPSGDDAAGMYYTQQTYDWKGRPLVTTNPDGTTKEASYAGCGCAGGEVVTLTDEGTIDAGVAKRRQQKIYSDVLGRALKTEILNWQGGSVYSTTVNSYNARDQITQVRQYAGAEGSGTYQDTTLTYDGYGRLKTKHVPEQSAGTATTYAYNIDDTVQSVTDARGAATIYSYYNRHLLRSKNYSVPQGSSIAVPASVTYEYDAAGNRTSMVDGLGSATYNYNSLSRMTSEVRSFSHPSTPLTYSISYQYNLAGDLTDITDPSNKTITYAHDFAGRLSAITGSSFSGVTSYLSTLQYRAWGAIKHANYGNGKTLDASYNNRLKVASFQIPGLLSKIYDYYADGVLKFSSDLIDHRFDRLYRWDHTNRLKEAYSGGEARGEAPSNNRPYKEIFSYSPMDHLTQRTDWFWSAGATTTSDSYTNNRHDPVGQLWQYDADGNLLMMPGSSYTYDAGGRVDTAWSGSSATFGLDGDGKKIKSVEVVWDPVQETDVTTYSLSIYSSVLGKLLTEKTTNDDPHSPYAYFTSRTFVYGDSGVIASQESNTSLSQWVWWEHRDPSNASYRTSTSSGQLGDQQELDPTGANRGVSNTTYQSVMDEGILAPYPASNNPAQPNTTYSVDGIRVSLDDFIQNLQVFFKGNLGLNEGLARQSADNRNFQSRLVRTVFTIENSGSRESEDGDVIIFDRGEGQIVSEQWETTALSRGGTLGSLIGATGRLQNAQPLPTDLKTKVANIVSNVKTDCADFIKKLIGNLKDKAFSNNPITLYERVEKEKKFRLGNTGKYSGLSDMPGGKRQIRIRPIDSTTDPRLAEHQAYAYAVTALNELMHHAKDSGLYTDRQLAVAIFPLLSSEMQAAHPLPQKSDEDTNSLYFHSLFNLHCRSLTGE